MCGERRLRSDEFSLRRLLTEGLSDSFGFDSKLWRSLKSLVARPGAATVAYMSGRRAGRMGPVQLFLTCNLVYFVAQPFTIYTGFNTPLDSHMYRQVYSRSFDIAARVNQTVGDRARERVRREAAQLRAAGETVTPADSVAMWEAAAEIEAEVYPTRFNARGEVYARALVALIIPMLVLVLALLYAGRRVPLVKHVVFATHLHAWELFFVSSVFLFALGWSARGGFLFLSAVTGLSPQEIAAHQLTRWFDSLVLENGSLVVVFTYIYLALRRAYGDGRAAAVVRAAVLTASTLYFTFVYRFLLFWVTYATT